MTRAAISSTLPVPLMRAQRGACAFSRVADVGFPRQPKEDDLKVSIRAFFPNGGSMTFQLERWDHQGIVGNSPNFGRVTFAPTTFARVELYPAPIKSAAAASPGSTLRE